MKSISDKKLKKYILKAIKEQKLKNSKLNNNDDVPPFKSINETNKRTKKQALKDQINNIEESVEPSSKKRKLDSSAEGDKIESEDDVEEDEELIEQGEDTKNGIEEEEEMSDNVSTVSSVEGYLEQGEESSEESSDDSSDEESEEKVENKGEDVGDEPVKKSQDNSILDSYMKSLESTDETVLDRDNTRMKINELMLNQRIPFKKESVVESEDEEESSDEEMSEDENEKSKKLLRFVKEEVVNEKPAEKEEHFLVNEQKQITNDMDTKVGKLHTGGNIQLSDLLETIDPKNEQNNESGSKMIKQFENYTSLERIARDTEKGKIYRPTEDIELDLNERRIAFQVNSKKMEKWDKVVDYMYNSRRLPLTFEDKSLVKSFSETKPRIIDDFDTKYETAFLKQEKDKTDEEIIEFGVQEEPEADLLSKKDLIHRAEEIRKRREALQNQGQKLARLKKIKSKTYRKILKKQKSKDENKKFEDLSALSTHELKDLLKQQEDDYLMGRIRLKHKNKSKWAKRAVGEAHHNESLREAINSQLSKRQELEKRRKLIEEYYNSDEEDRIVDQLMNDNTDKSTEKKNLLNKMREEIGSSDEESNKKSTSKGNKGSLYNMKFMKVARDKRKREQVDLIDQLEEDLNSHFKDFTSNTGEKKGMRTSYNKQSKLNLQMNDVNDEESFMDVSNLDKNATKTSKIIKTSSTTIDPKNQVKIKVEEEEQEVEKKLNDKIVNNAKLNANKIIVEGLTKPEKKKKVKVSIDRNNKPKLRTFAVETESNPWLNMKVQSRHRTEKVERKVKEKEEAKVELALDSKSLGLSSDASEKSQGKIKTEEAEKEKNQKDFQQMVKQKAFETDDLELEFELAKEKEIQESIKLPDLESNVQIGWDTWAGKGMEEEEKKRQEKLEEIKGVKGQLVQMYKKERPDFAKDRVIIRHTATTDAQYLVSSHPKEQVRNIIDNSMSHPIGSEWNTTSSFLDINKPRILPRGGESIAPLKFTETLEQRSSTTETMQDIKRKRRKEKRDEYKRRAQKEYRRKQQHQARMKKEKSSLIV